MGQNRLHLPARLTPSVTATVTSNVRYPPCNPIKIKFPARADRNKKRNRKQSPAHDGTHTNAHTQHQSRTTHDETGSTRIGTVDGLARGGDHLRGKNFLLETPSSSDDSASGESW